MNSWKIYPMSGYAGTLRECVRKEACEGSKCLYLHQRLHHQASGCWLEDNNQTLAISNVSGQNRSLTPQRIPAFRTCIDDGISCSRNATTLDQYQPLGRRAGQPLARPPHPDLVTRVAGRAAPFHRVMSPWERTSAASLASL